jgi:hypothetical protein
MLRRRRVRLALVVVLLALGVIVTSAYLMAPPSPTAAACPPGYQREEDGGPECINMKHPEPAQELILRQEGLESVRSAPYDHVAPGAYANALAEREAVAKEPKVQGTDGAWSLYGKGPLIVNHPDYRSVNGLGLVDNAGRLDSLESAEGRLFAAKGTGGVWMSTDRGATWTSIGDSLPSQVVGAVGWTSANGGTVLAVSGDPSFGSGGYTGYGAFYSNDLGATWQKAAGVPDGALGFAIEADPANPNVVYAATSIGLYRSTDGGRTYGNVNLPTSTACQGQGATRECLLANVVTDVEVVTPGGVNTTTQAGTVLAAVGWRAGPRLNSDGTVQAPGNGLYRSATGESGSFRKVEPLPGTFTQQDRIGRVELGATTGPAQDHDYLYAIVQDAQALNGQLDILDVPLPDPRQGVGSGGTVLNGIYVSADFGQTWTLMADDNAIARNPASGSALTGASSGTGYEPGVQGWYNLFIAPDPTRQTAEGVPTRLAFGLEEVWQNEVTTQPMNGPAAFKVIGRYYADRTCAGLIFGTKPPACPTDRELTTSRTTHPDQQDGIWIPTGDGGVTLAVGNDGGFYRNTVAAGAEISNDGWGDGDQAGFATLLPYDVAMANDGTAYAGLQDNGEMKVTPDGTQYEVYGGDGGFTEVDPFNSNIAYEEYVFAAMRVTTDGGKTWREMPPGVTSPRFINPFEMDATSPTHLVTGGNEIVETIYGPETNGPDDTGACSLNCWKKVFDLGTHSRPGDPAATPPVTDPASDPNFSTSAIDVYGDAVYAGFCGVCDILNAKAKFKSGIATNVGGSAAPERMTSNGWHVAKAAGLPNRFITSVTIDPRNIRTVYVTLGGYSRRWVPPGTLQDENANVGEGHLFKSTDAGETFTDISGNLPDVPATSLALRGSQLIVGTDIGVFASDPKGGKRFALLKGLPNVPVSIVNLKPNDPDLLVAATYGRGIWTYRFAESLKKPPVQATPTSCPNTTERPALPLAPATIAGPYGFEASEDGWTAGSTSDAHALWRRTAPGNVSAFGFSVSPYNSSYPLANTASTMLTSPKLSQAGGWVVVEFANRRDLEPGFDYMFVEWSCDGGSSWNSAPWVWDPNAEDWSSTFQYDGVNHSYPLYDVEKVAFKAPAGSLNVRFRLTADQLIGSPLYLGAWVDDVVVKQ